MTKIIINNRDKLFECELGDPQSIIVFGPHHDVTHKITCDNNADEYCVTETKEQKTLLKERKSDE